MMGCGPSLTGVLILGVLSLSVFGADIYNKFKDIRDSANYFITHDEEAIARKSCERLAEIYVAGFVRTIFHDCNGGCNGCIDLGNDDNAGLDEYMEELEEGYVNDGIYKFMRRSDYWALCSWEAVKAGHANSELKRPTDRLREITMVYGRPECAPYPKKPNQPSENEFPRGHGDWAETAEFFRQEFGFRNCETVAILGAHSLGEAKKKNSGFDGEWVENEEGLDHDYYIQIYNRSNAWTQVNVGPAKNGEDRWQYVHSKGKEMLMLNADMCVAFDIQPNAAGRVANPDPTKSPPSPGDVCARRYRDNNQAFLDDFVDVFEKMITHTKSFIPLRRAIPVRLSIPTRRPVSSRPSSPSPSTSYRDRLTSRFPGQLSNVLRRWG